MITQPSTPNGATSGSDPNGAYQRVRAAIVALLPDKPTDVALALFGGGAVFVAFMQYRVARKQTDILAQQRAIMAMQLVPQGPFIEYVGYKVELAAADIDKGILGNWKINLGMKNVGRDVAVNAGYFQGMRVLAANSDALKDEDFAKTIFRSSKTVGLVSVGVDQTIETDQITVNPAQLRSLYSKQVRMFVWIVMTYGSRLQDNPDWFAEVAMQLEFVLSVDPDTYKAPERGSVSGIPFRVARAGYRYRESGKHEQRDGRS